MVSRVCLLVLIFVAGCGSPAERPADNVPAAPAPPPSAPPAPPPVASEPPGMPYEDFGACPFEGCTYREWTAREAVPVLADHRDGAAVAFTVAPGERVIALSGLVRVTRPGRITFTAPAAIETSAGPIEMRAGETIYLLTPTGEGHHVGSIRGRIIRDVDGGSGPLVEPVQYEWWAQVQNAAGRVGWVRMMRQFDGTDRLA
jgi:hypothetical protein